MLEIQKEYLEYISKIDDEAAKTNLTDLAVEKFHFKESSEAIKTTELIVPIVGAFSAGKSSLLNSFLGEKKLPEGITPETALATELRYLEHESIEAVKDDGSTETFPIDAIETIKKRAGDFKCLRMYLNNNNLKEIEPLILVDMPGFESSLDLHNKAIMEYINKGVHYVVLTSVEDGNITKSMTRQLENIREYKRDFSFFLSKTNLILKDEVGEINLKIQEQLKDHFNKTGKIGLVDNNGGESLKLILCQINPEKLFENIFLDSLKDNFFSIREAINTNISALSKSQEQNNAAIEQLKKALNETTNKKHNLIKEAKEKYSYTNIDRIINKVGRDISNNIDEITSAGTKSHEAFSRIFSEIVKNSLISNIKETMSEIVDDIVDDFSNDLRSLDGTMSEFTNGKWLENITGTTKKIFNSVSNRINESLKNKEHDKPEIPYKVITTILALTTAVLNPILEFVIIFLPDIAASFLESRKKEKIRQTILTETIPALKRRLKIELSEHFNSQINQMIQNIGSQFEENIKEKQGHIESSQKEMDEKNIDIEKTIQDFKNANDCIATLANNTLYRS